MALTLDALIPLLDDPDGLARVKRYVAEGGDLEARLEGMTLLMFAARCDRGGVLEYLVESGADLDAADVHTGWTSLHDAVDSDIQDERSAVLDRTRRLIELGADERAEDLQGATARDVAAAYGAHALGLYDGLSRLDWSAEPTLEAFHERCRQALASGGFDLRQVDSGQLSVSRSAEGHSDPWGRLFLLTGSAYRNRRRPDFERELVEEFRLAFAEQDERAGRRPK